MALNVVMLVPSLIECGPLIVAENIIKYSKQDDVNYIFISLRKNDSSVCENFQKNNFKYKDLGMGKLPSIKTVFLLKKYLKEFKADIIHAHCFWPMILSCFCVRTYKVLMTLHNNPKEDYKFSYGAFVGKIMMWITFFCINQLDAAVAISKYVKNVYTNVKGSSKIVMVYNAVEDCNSNRIINKFNDEIKIISVGNLIEIKNFSTALYVIQRLRNKGFKVKYTLVGTGPLRENLEGLSSELKISDCVVFTGTLSRTDTMNKLKESNIFLFPSYNEGFSLAVAEAMMCGLPVVCSNIEVMKELITVNENGFLCDVEDLDQYVKSIEKLMDPVMLERFSNKARAAYEKSYRPQLMANKYVQIYKSLFL